MAKTSKQHINSFAKSGGEGGTMKKTITAVIGIIFALTSTAALAADPPDKAYFNQQFGALQRSAAEIKGDTAQILGILGNVFEGTVPEGGTLTKLCNENGWSLVVVMGHNGITDPNIVAVGKVFTYPQTAGEFAQALAKGKPLYDAWLKTQTTTFRVNRVKVDAAEIDELNVRVATFKEKLAIKDMEVDKLKIRLAEFTEKLSVKEAEIEELNVEVANLGKVNIQELRIKEVLIEKLRIKQLEIDNLRELLTAAEGQIAQAYAPVSVRKAGQNPCSNPAGCESSKPKNLKKCTQVVGWKALPCGEQVALIICEPKGDKLRHGDISVARRFDPRKSKTGDGWYLGLVVYSESEPHPDFDCWPPAGHKVWEVLGKLCQETERLGNPNLYDTCGWQLVGNIPIPK